MSKAEFLSVPGTQLIVAATVLYRFGPDLPHLVSANPPTVEESAAQAAKNKLWKTLSPWFNCVWSALGLTADAGQVRAGTSPRCLPDLG